MFLSEYLINTTINYNQILEGFGSYDSPTEEEPETEEEPIVPVEFENIKRYVLYERLKDIKQRLDMSDLDNRNPEVASVLEFSNLIATFFNSFSYADTVKLIDTLVDAIENILGIKLPDRVPQDSPEETPAPNAIPAQQLGAVAQQPGQQLGTVAPQQPNTNVQPNPTQPQ
jgi:hypothetical protein